MPSADQVPVKSSRSKMRWHVVGCPDRPARGDTDRSSGAKASAMRPGMGRSASASDRPRRAPVALRDPSRWGTGNGRSAFYYWWRSPAECWGASTSGSSRPAQASKRQASHPVGSVCRDQRQGEYTNSAANGSPIVAPGVNAIARTQICRVAERLFRAFALAAAKTLGIARTAAAGHRLLSLRPAVKRLQWQSDQ